MIVIEKDERTNYTKGIIRIKFTAVNIDCWSEIYARYGVAVFINNLTRIALDKFESVMGRPFLLSDYCVFKETFDHLIGYLWSCGKKVAVEPYKFVAYYIK